MADDVLTYEEATEVPDSLTFEEAAGGPSTEDRAATLQFAVRAPQDITSTLLSTMQAGAPGSEMGRQEAQRDREAAMALPRAPRVAAVEPSTLLPGEAPPAVPGQASLRPQTEREFVRGGPVARFLFGPPEAEVAGMPEGKPGAAAGVVPVLSTVLPFGPAPESLAGKALFAYFAGSFLKNQPQVLRQVGQAIQQKDWGSMRELVGDEMLSGAFLAAGAHGALNRPRFGMPEGLRQVRTPGAEAPQPTEGVQVYAPQERQRPLIGEHPGVPSRIDLSSDVGQIRQEEGERPGGGGGVQPGAPGEAPGVPQEGSARVLLTETKDQRLARIRQEADEGKAEELKEIGERIKSGDLKSENIKLTINPGFPLPDGTTTKGYVQVDEVHPTEGNKWSSNPDALRSVGLDIPSEADLLKLKGGQYSLEEVRKMVAEAKTTESAPEKITAAAYRTPEGKVETGPNHPSILGRLGVKGFESPESRNTENFGFVTDKGRFITREDAGPLAEKSGQALKEFEPAEPVHSNEVASPTQPEKPLSETTVPRGTIPPAAAPVEAAAPATKVEAEVAKVAVAQQIPLVSPAQSAAYESHSHYEDVGPGNETQTEMNRHGTASGLPPGVPDNGPNFPAELLEASRRLGTLARTRATLPPGVMGMYSRRRGAVSQNDKIEVGDLHNQLTVAHEMGHDLDQLLWPQVNLAKSQKSLLPRAGSFGTIKELHSELVKVSELMRGPITGTKGHIAYRRSATELIADFFALYAHDPGRARAMAPRFSKAFEAALARNPNAEETVQQLHAENVIPVAPTRPTPSAPTGQAAEMPGKVPARPEAPPVSRDAQTAVAAESLVKGLVRKFEAEVQRARIIADRWRRLVPGQADRNDVGAFVEGIGNLEKPGDTIDAVRSRMTPEKQRFAKDYRLGQEVQRGNINAYLKGTTQGEYLSFLEDYLAHFYVNSKTPAGQQATARFIKNSPNAKQRKIPTLQEAVEYGLIPITQDPAVTFENHARINWRVATNRMLMARAKDMKTASGEPVIVPAGKAPPGYVRSDNPLIQRVYAHKAGEATMLWRGGAGIHPDAWRAFRMMLETPMSTDLAKVYDALNAITRANAFAFSLFHDTTLRFASTGAQWSWYNPARGLFRLFERNPITGELEVLRSTRKLGMEMLDDEKTVVDAALHGLKFAWNDSESYQMNARDFLEKSAARWRDVPILGKTARIARDLQHMRQQSLWKNTHDALKLAAYNDIVTKALQDAPPGTDSKTVKEQVASLLNDAFGGQEWQTKFWLSPNTKRIMARFFLAPDWTFSTIRSVPFVSDAASVTRGQLPRIAGREPIPTVQEGLGGNLGRLRFWGGELAALAMATLAAQYAIYQAFGKKDKGDHEWVWENESGQNRRIDVTPIMRHLPWKDPQDPTRYYVNLGKRPEEILGYFTHFDQNILSKVARPVAEVFRQVTGTEGEFKAQWKRDHETFIESLPARAKAAAGQFFPFVFQGNQFALSLPYRKGMTKYKAQQAYESTYELAANPGALTPARAFLRGVPNPQGTLHEMVEQITDAAERNGVPSEEIRKRALSEVRGKYYDQFFKAFQKNDEPAMNKAAESLERLGATPIQIEKSRQRRAGLQPQPME